MKIKFTGLQEKIFICLRVSGVEYKKHLIRNQWYDIKDEKLSEILLRSKNFISEENLKFDGNVSTNGVILLKRGYALGDLIQLVPVIKYMKRKLNYKFALWTSFQFAEIMKWFNIFEEVHSEKPRKVYEKFLILDGVLESDHSLSNTEREIHRIKIFENFFGIEIDEYDFTPERN